MPTYLLKIPFQEIDSLPLTLNSYGETEILYSYEERNDIVAAFENEILKSKSSYRKVDKIIKGLLPVQLKII